MNGTIGMVEAAFGIELVENGGLLPFLDVIAEQDRLAQDLGSNSTGLNTLLTFGDFIKGTQFFIDFITLQFFADIVQSIVQMVQVNEGNGAQVTSIFIYMIRAVCAAVGLIGLWYMATGRGTEANA